MNNRDLNQDEWGIPENAPLPKKSVKPSIGNIINSEWGMPEPSSTKVNTFLGSMERRPAKFMSGTPEHKELIQNMMEGLSGILPEINIVGGLINKGLGLGKGATKVTKSAFKNIEPYEEAASKASKEAEVATELANPVKPGIIKSPITELENIENQIGKEINIGGAHHVNVGRFLQQRIPVIKKYWQDSYKNFLGKLENSKFEMPSSAMENLDYEKLNPTQLVKKYGADAYEALKKGKIESFLKKQAETDLPKNPYYKKLLSEAPTSKDTKASTFLNKYKDFRDYIFKLKEDLQNPNISSSEKEHISDALNKGKGMRSQIESTLKEGLGEHLPEFEWLNKGYSEEFYPLSFNKVAKKAVETGKLSKNMAEELSGTGKGQELLRNIIKSDKEAIRNILGQQYKNKPASLHNADELVQDYLNENPQLQKLLEHKERTLSETAKRKNLTLKEKVRTEKELKDIKKQKAKAKKSLLIGSGTVGSLIGIPYGATKLMKMLIPSEE